MHNVHQSHEPSADIPVRYFLAALLLPAHCPIQWASSKARWKEDAPQSNRHSPRPQLISVGLLQIAFFVCAPFCMRPLLYATLLYAPHAAARSLPCWVGHRCARHSPVPWVGTAGRVHIAPFLRSRCSVLLATVGFTLTCMERQKHVASILRSRAMGRWPCHGPLTGVPISSFFQLPCCCLPVALVV